MPSGGAALIIAVLGTTRPGDWPASHTASNMLNPGTRLRTPE
ncbi:hypothetical protein [Arthrobacter sp. NicSoilB8]|nr:hypothetical protein [Arthrobacter sp. NicSoilB8]